MRFNTQERKINTEGHALIAKGRELILEAEKLREQRKASYERAIIDQKRRQEERVARQRKECMESGDNLMKDIHSSQFAYPGLVVDEVTSNYMDGGSIGDRGTITIRFHRKY